jgi:hypothetical protein
LARIIGAVDPRLPSTGIEYVGIAHPTNGAPSSTPPSLIAQTATYEVYTVRWPVFGGVSSWAWWSQQTVTTAADGALSALSRRS